MQTERSFYTSFFYSRSGTRIYEAHKSMLESTTNFTEAERTQRMWRNEANEETHKECA